MSHQYKNKLTWLEGKKAKFSIEGKPSLEIATPEDFGGPSGYLSPEDLFLASVNSCLMTTFLYFKDKKEIDIKSYSSEASAELLKTQKGLIFSKIDIKLDVKAENENQQGEIAGLIKLAKKYCVISNSITSEVNIIY